jgi:hypothetical protein
LAPSPEKVFVEVKILKRQREEQQQQHRDDYVVFFKWRSSFPFYISLVECTTTYKSTHTHINTQNYTSMISCTISLPLI